MILVWTPLVYIDFNVFNVWLLFHRVLSLEPTDNVSWMLMVHCYDGVDRWWRVSSCQTICALKRIHSSCSQRNTSIFADCFEEITTFFVKIACRTFFFWLNFRVVLTLECFGFFSEATCLSNNITKGVEPCCG